MSKDQFSGESAPRPELTDTDRRTMDVMGWGEDEVVVAGQLQVGDEHVATVVLLTDEAQAQRREEAKGGGDPGFIQKALRRIRENLQYPC